jgi:hypothetical protein
MDICIYISYTYSLNVVVYNILIIHVFFNCNPSHEIGCRVFYYGIMAALKKYDFGVFQTSDVWIRDAQPVFYLVSSIHFYLSI